jgi:protease PrsW
MSRFLIVLAAVAPSLLMLSYGIAKARGSWRSEAMWHAFFVGALSALAAVGIELVLAGVVKLGHPSPVANAALTAIFVAAIPEEGIKFVALILLAERHVEVRRLQDIIVLGVAVSLGFATVENFWYVAEAGKWQEVAVLRAVAAVPAHGILGLLMGALLAAARLHPARDPTRIILALLVPVVCHAAYDFPAIAIEEGATRGPFTAAWFLAVVCSSILAIVLCDRFWPKRPRLTKLRVATWARSKRLTCSLSAACCRCSSGRCWPERFFTPRALNTPWRWSCSVFYRSHWESMRSSVACIASASATSNCSIPGSARRKRASCRRGKRNRHAYSTRAQPSGVRRSWGRKRLL